MARWHNLTPVRALLTLAALTVALLGAGCSAHVESGGGDGDGGGGGGSSSSGDACKAFCMADPAVCASPCKMGDEYHCPYWPQAPTLSCQVREGCPNVWYGDCSTPLVLSFDRAPVDFTPASSSFDFDLTGTGVSVPTDWPTARTPWLALDRDGDGRINGGGELFGSATRLADGSLATNGFVALRELDDNGDGRITPEDKAWPRLVLWSDRDDSRASTAGEIASVSSRRLLSIELVYTTGARCDARGNCEVERATFRYLDEAGIERTGDIVDVHLKVITPGT